MEGSLKNIQVYNKECIGCQKFKKDIMISFMTEEDRNEIHDIFLTTEQAEYLRDRLTKRLKENTKEK